MDIGIQNAARLALLALVLASAPTPAAVLTVTQLGDAGPGSLRAAIEALPADQHNRIEITAPAGTLQLASSLPALRGLSVQIAGLGQVVDGGGAHRIFAATVPVSLSGLVLRNGQATLRSGCLDVVGVTLVEFSRFEGCRAGAGSANGYGGAVTVSGTLTVRSSEFVGNLARGNGGAGEQAGGAVYHTGGALRVEDSLFEGNRVEAGSGVGTRGGAISSANGSVEIHRSRFIDNRVEGSEGGGGALRCFNATQCAVLRSFFGGNHSGGGGGAVYAQDSVVLVENSSFFGGSGRLGGALYVTGAASGLRLRASSFLGNETTSTGFGRQGGHLFLNGSVNLIEVSNTAFAATTVGNACYANGASPSYAGPGFNRMVDVSCAPMLGSDSLRITPAEFGLSTPQRVGPVESLRPAGTSALVDAGSGATVGSGPGACPGVDVDGRLRPQPGAHGREARCDIGAVEFAPELFASGFEDTPVP
jgi:predicted outer membrane repeat protein